MKKPKRKKRQRAKPAAGKTPERTALGLGSTDKPPLEPGEEDYGSPIESWNAALQKEQDEFDAAEALLTEEEKHERMKRLCEFIKLKQAERN